MTDHTTPGPERIDALMTVEEVAELLRMPVATIRHWRVLGTGPRGSLSGVGCAISARTSSIGSTSSVTPPDAGSPEFSTAVPSRRARQRSR
jgi:hypothetical protein